MAGFIVTGFPGYLAAIGQTITDQPKPFAVAVYDRNQEDGTALGEQEEKGRLACSASPLTSTPSNLTRPAVGATPGFRCRIGGVGGMRNGDAKALEIKGELGNE